MHPPFSKDCAGEFNHLFVVENSMTFSSNTVIVSSALNCRSSLEHVGSNRNMVSWERLRQVQMGNWFICCVCG